MSPNHSTRPFLAVREVAFLLGICERTVFRWVKAGKLPPPLRLGPKSLRWRRGELRKVLGRGV